MPGNNTHIRLYRWGGSGYGDAIHKYLNFPHSDYMVEYMMKLICNDARARVMFAGKSILPDKDVVPGQNYENAPRVVAIDSGSVTVAGDTSVGWEKGLYDRAEKWTAHLNVETGTMVLSSPTVNDLRVSVRYDESLKTLFPQWEAVSIPFRFNMAVENEPVSSSFSFRAINPFKVPSAWGDEFFTTQGGESLSYAGKDIVFNLLVELYAHAHQSQAQYG